MRTIKHEATVDIEREKVPSINKRAFLRKVQQSIELEKDADVQKLLEGVKWTISVENGKYVLASSTGYQCSLQKVTGESANTFQFMVNDPDDVVIGVLKAKDKMDFLHKLRTKIMEPSFLKSTDENEAEPAAKSIVIDSSAMPDDLLTLIQKVALSKYDIEIGNTNSENIPTRLLVYKTVEKKNEQNNTIGTTKKLVRKYDHTAPEKLNDTLKALFTKILNEMPQFESEEKEANPQ